MANHPPAGVLVKDGNCGPGRRIIHIIFVLACVLSCASPARAADRYVLGMSAAFTGPSGGLGIELYRGSMAYFVPLNARGGIGGRTVEIVTMDDGYQPDPVVENTIEFLKAEDIQCLFNYVGTPTVTRILPLLNGYKGGRKLLFFPFTGAEPQRQPPYKPFVFNLRASYLQELAGLVERFVALNRSRMAVFYQADAYGRGGWEGARRALEAKGSKLACEATYRRGVRFEESMARQVEILKQAKPDVILSVGSYAACAAFIRDARDLGLDVPIANVSFVGSEHLLALLEGAGREQGRDYTRDLINTQVVPSYEDLSLPAVREYRERMDSIRPTPPDMADPGYRPLPYSFTGFEGYLNAKVMAHILEIYSKNPGMGLGRAAESVKDLDIGIDAPVNLNPSRHQGLDRVYFTTVRGGKFVPIDEEHWRSWQK